MKKFTKETAAVIAFSVCAGIASNSFAATTNVNVVNTATSPVPVTGSVGVNGTANVKVTNTTPVPVSGAVNVSGTVSVGNTRANPVNVTQISNTTTQLLSPTSFTIPASSTMGMGIADVSRCSSVRFNIMQIPPESGPNAGPVACQLIDLDTNANIAAGQLTSPASPLNNYSPSLSIEVNTPALRIGINCINSDNTLNSPVSFALYCR